MRKIIVSILFAMALFSITGCNGSALEGDNLVLVDFKPEPLKYKFVADRQYKIQLAPDTDKVKAEQFSEKLEMVISYQPVGEPNPYGLTDVKATVESAKVARKMRKNTPKDVVETLAGKSYTFKVSPTGEISDVSELFELASELGKAAIIDSGRQGRIRNPDMIADFVAMQLYLWDPIASAEQTVEGFKQGDTWKSKQFIPLPVPIGFAKEVEYRFDSDVEKEGIEDTNADNNVLITSTFSPGEGKLDKWPKIYSGNFNMRGQLGVLRGFHLKTVDGKGESVFNVDNGVLVKSTQQYKVEVGAIFLLPLAGTSPKLIVDQEITIELMDN